MESDLINGMTEEEIKRGLGWIAYDCDGEDCDLCEYVESCHKVTEDEVASDALALIGRLEAERNAALKAIPRTCATCEHALYRTISEEEGCKTISVFCKEKECRNVDKWQMCEAQTNERKEEGD